MRGYVTSNNHRFGQINSKEITEYFDSCVTKDNVLNTRQHYLQRIWWDNSTVAWFSYEHSGKFFVFETVTVSHYKVPMI